MAFRPPACYRLILLYLLGLVQDDLITIKVEEIDNVWAISLNHWSKWIYWRKRLNYFLILALHLVVILIILLLLLRHQCLIAPLLLAHWDINWILIWILAWMHCRSYSRFLFKYIYYNIKWKLTPKFQKNIPKIKTRDLRSCRFEICYLKFNQWRKDNGQDDAEDHQTRQLRNQPEERLLHVGLQQLHQYSAEYLAGKGPQDLGSYVWWGKIEALPQASAQKLCGKSRRGCSLGKRRMEAPNHFRSWTREYWEQWWGPESDQEIIWAEHDKQSSARHWLAPSSTFNIET